VRLHDLSCALKPAHALALEQGFLRPLSATYYIIHLFFNHKIHCFVQGFSIISMYIFTALALALAARACERLIVLIHVVGCLSFLGLHHGEVVVALHLNHFLFHLVVLHINYLLFAGVFGFGAHAPAPCPASLVHPHLALPFFARAPRLAPAPRASLSDLVIQLSPLRGARRPGALAPGLLPAARGGRLRLHEVAPVAAAAVVLSIRRRRLAGRPPHAAGLGGGILSNHFYIPRVCTDRRADFISCA
jgi:hypothetical protein